MITPQEAESHVFSKATFGSGGGYHMGQVDAFLDTLISDYAALFKENAVLKSKMKALAEKLEEYRSTEDAMRQTLLSAQKMAEGIRAEAEGKRAEAVAKAESDVRARMAEMQKEVQTEELRLQAARSATIKYIKKLKGLYTHELEYIEHLSEVTPSNGGGEILLNSVQEIDEAVSRLVPGGEGAESGGALGEQPAAPAQAAQREPAQDTVIFDKLEAGKDYEFH
jgi:cell division initiation protein